MYDNASVGYFVFGASDLEAYNYLVLYHRGSQEAPDGYKIVEGKVFQSVSGTKTNSNAPSKGSTKTLWVRVSSNGTSVTVKEMAVNIGDPAPSEGGL